MLLNVAYLFAGLLQGHVQGVGQLKAKGVPPAQVQQFPSAKSPLALCEHIHKHVCTPEAIKAGTCKCGALNVCHPLGLSCQDTVTFVDNAQLWSSKRMRALKVVIFGDPAAAFTSQLVMTADQIKTDKRATAIYLLTPNPNDTTKIIKGNTFPDVVKESLDRQGDNSKPIIKIGRHYSILMTDVILFL